MFATARATDEAPAELPTTGTAKIPIRTQTTATTLSRRVGAVSSGTQPHFRLANAQITIPTVTATASRLQFHRSSCRRRATGMITFRPAIAFGIAADQLLRAHGCVPRSRDLQSRRSRQAADSRKAEIVGRCHLCQRLTRFRHQDQLRDWADWSPAGYDRNQF